MRSERDANREMDEALRATPFNGIRKRNNMPRQNENQGRGPHPRQPTASDVVLAILIGLVVWFVLSGGAAWLRR